MKLPESWRDYDCGDYFDSDLAGKGYWDEPGQYWYIRPSGQIHETKAKDFLVIGGAGVDGIEWGYRRGEPGLWAWYPIEGLFVWLAPTAEALLRGWLSGSIKI